jgi:hypothetical protein
MLSYFIVFLLTLFPTSVMLSQILKPASIVVAEFSTKGSHLSVAKVQATKKECVFSIISYETEILTVSQATGKENGRTEDLVWANLLWMGERDFCKRSKMLLRGETPFEPVTDKHERLLVKKKREAESVTKNDRTFAGLDLYLNQLLTVEIGGHILSTKPAAANHIISFDMVIRV